MEAPGVGAKRSWQDQQEGLGSMLADDFQLESSFLQTDLIDIPDLANDSILTFDSASDVFPGFDLDLGLGGPTTDDLALGDQLSAGVLGGRPRGVSPSTSESGNLEMRQPLTDSTSRGRDSSEDEQKQGPEEDEAKRLARMQRNRENAHLSRQRKKQQMTELQQQCTQLRTQNTQITCLVHRLVAENCLLRHHLGNACKAANLPVPEVPSAMKSGAPAGTTPAPPLAQQQQQLQQGLIGVAPATLRGPMVPLVPQRGMPGAAIPQPQNAAPVPAATQQAAAAAAAAAASSRPVRKRARMTGAGAAFLAMFSIFLFVGPFVPGAAPQQQYSSLPGPITSGLLLPAATSASNAIPARSGRSLLQALPPSDEPHPDNNNNNQQLLLSQMFNETLEALLQDPRSGDIRAQALQRLQELAPAAVLLDVDPSPASTLEDGKASVGGNTLAMSSAFPILADQFFKAAGLEAPQTCQKVFEFDASALPHPTRSRRSVERYIMGTYGFKGRSAGLTVGAEASLAAPAVHSKVIPGPLQLPSVGDSKDVDGSALVVAQKNELLRIGDALLDDSEPRDDTFEDIEASGSGSVILPASVSEPTLVSVLLPANASRSTNGELTAVDRVYVVLLHPQNKFVTYSCGLPRSLLV